MSLINISKLTAAAAAVETGADAEAAKLALPAIAALAALEDAAAMSDDAREQGLVAAGKELVFVIADAVGTLGEEELFAYYRDAKAHKEAPFVKAAKAETGRAKLAYGYEHRSDTRKAAWRKVESRAVTVGLAIGYLQSLGDDGIDIVEQFRRDELSLSKLASQLPASAREANKAANKEAAEAEREAAIEEAIAERGLIDASQMQVFTLSDAARMVAGALDADMVPAEHEKAIADLLDAVTAYSARVAAKAAKPAKRKAA